MSIVNAEECQVCAKAYYGDGTHEQLCAGCYADVATYHTKLLGAPPVLCRGFYYEHSDIVESYLNYCEEIAESEIGKLLAHVKEHKK